MRTLLNYLQHVEYCELDSALFSETRPGVIRPAFADIERKSRGEFAPLSLSLISGSPHLVGPSQACFCSSRQKKSKGGHLSFQRMVKRRGTRLNTILQLVDRSRNQTLSYGK